MVLRQATYTSSAHTHNDWLNNCLNKAKHTHKITAAEHVRTWARSPPLGFSRFKLHQFPPTASTLDWAAYGLTECTRVTLTLSPLTLQCTQVSNTEQVPHHHQISYWQCLCQRVCFMLPNTNSFCDNLSSLNALPDEMKLSINVFATTMEYWVLHQCYC